MYLMWIEEIPVEKLVEHMKIAERSVAKPYPRFMKVLGMYATMSEETGNLMPIIILYIEKGKEEEAIQEINRRMLQYSHLGTKWKIRVLWEFKEIMKLVLQP